MATTTTANAARRGVVLHGHPPAGADGAAIVGDEGAIDGLAKVDRISEEECLAGDAAAAAAAAGTFPLPPASEAIITEEGGVVVEEDRLVLPLIITGAGHPPPGIIMTIICAGVVLGATTAEVVEDGAMDVGGHTITMEVVEVVEVV